VATFNCAIPDPIIGEMTFGLTAVQTALIEADDSLSGSKSKYVWELEMTDALGNVIPRYYGDVYVFRQLTY
jgi:ABC-type proline/glycine betaine transport system permease subunit